jgi:hypothetical protein
MHLSQAAYKEAHVINNSTATINNTDRIEELTVNTSTVSLNNFPSPESKDHTYVKSTHANTSTLMFNNCTWTEQPTIEGNNSTFIFNGWNLPHAPQINGNENRVYTYGSERYSWIKKAACTTIGIFLGIALSKLYTYYCNKK